LTNWYIRRSRDRFWAGGTAAEGMSRDKTDAYDTLYTVLVTLLGVAAPLLPLLTEEMYAGLADGSSIHLTDWPDAATLPDDPELVARMDRVRAVCSTALSLREDAGLRVRLPLARLTVAGESAIDLTEFADLIQDELNVKEWVLDDEADDYGTQVLRPNAKVLGPKLGGDVQKVIKAAKAGDWQANPDGTVTVAGAELAANEFELALEPAEGRTAAAVRMLDPEGRSIDLGLVVDLDTDVTPELAAEGLARDVIRIVQSVRKDRDLNVTDRIALRLGMSDRLAAAVRANETQLTRATLATSVDYLAATGTGAGAAAGTVDGEAITVELDVS
jgi:isoleucyl-tRNA synthetase